MFLAVQGTRSTCKVEAVEGFLIPSIKSPSATCVLIIFLDCRKRWTGERALRVQATDRESSSAGSRSEKNSVDSR